MYYILFCHVHLLKGWCSAASSAFTLTFIYDYYLITSERDLSRDDVVTLQDTKNRLTTHISELEQELKRYVLY